MAEQCRDPLIGWCAFSVDPIAEPQLVHKRVTHTLSKEPSSLLPRTANAPNLLCMLNLLKEHHEATVTLQYKAYISVDAVDQPEHNVDVTSGRVLAAVPVEILNTGDQRGERRYTSVWPSSFNFLAQGADEGTAMEMISSLEGIGLEPQKKLVNHLLEQCNALLSEYQKSVANVRSGVQTIHKRKAELARLKAQCRP